MTSDAEIWERLKQDLFRLIDAEPRVLSRYPDPRVDDDRTRPFSISLAATAESTAAQLHERYGDFVTLRVGALPYPPEVGTSRPRRSAFAVDAISADAAELYNVLDAALSVPSGETAGGAVQVTNRGSTEIRVHNNGRLYATVVDSDGMAVGGSSGGLRTQALHIFTAAPLKTVRIPVIVGTVSSRPELGYAIPPGDWHFVTTMNLADGRRVRSPLFDLTVE